MCLSKQAIADCLEYIEKKWDSLWSSSLGHVMTTRWLSRHPFQWTTSQITFALEGDMPMKTSLKEGTQKLKSNAPNTGACSVMVKK